MFCSTKNGVSKTDGVKTDPLLRDLGLGKETQFSYPWYPDPNANSLCEKAKSYTADKFPDSVGNLFYEDGKPAKDCNEFVFTRV